MNWARIRRRFSTDVIRASVVLAVGLLVVASPLEVRAQEEVPDRDEVDEETVQRVLTLIREGKRAYENEKYETAFTKFEDAYELWPRKRILIQLGKTAENLKRYRRAHRYYMEFLDAEPDDPELAREAANRVSELNDNHLGRVDVESSPEGASIHLESADGELLGETPATIRLESGTYGLVVTKDGHEPAEESVSVEVGSVGELSVELEEKESEQRTTADESTEKPSERPESEGSASLDSNSETEPEPSRGGRKRRPDRKFLSVLGWSSGVGGVIGIGTGVGLTVLQNEAEQEAEEFDRGAESSSRSELRDIRDRARRRHREALIAFSAGGALLAVGTAIFVQNLFANTSEDESSAQSAKPFDPTVYPVGVRLRF